MEQANRSAVVQTLFEVLAAFNAGDLMAVEKLVDPNVTYRIPGRARVSGQFTGPAEVIAAFGRLRELSGGTITVTPQVVLDDGEQVLFTGRGTAQHDGRVLDVVNAYAFRFRDGKLISGQMFAGDPEAVEAFFR